MSRYIDAEKLIEYAEKRKLQGVPVDVIKSKATADVEEVVRCKDCKYLEIESGGYATCGKAWRGIVQPWDSCGKGKKGIKNNRRNNRNVRRKDVLAGRYRDL